MTERRLAAGPDRNGGPEEVGYNVALRCNKTGVITWTTYPNKAELDAERGELAKNYSIVGEGISDSECVSLVRTTPAKAYTKMAFEKCTDPNGDINFDFLPHELQMAAWAGNRKGS